LSVSVSGIEFLISRFRFWQKHRLTEFSVSVNRNIPSELYIKHATGLVAAAKSGAGRDAQPGRQCDGHVGTGAVQEATARPNAFVGHGRRLARRPLAAPPPLQLQRRPLCWPARRRRASDAGDYFPFVYSTFGNGV